LNPLAQESGEFPEVGYIDARLLPYCYEAGLESAAPESAQLVSAATESFIKVVLTAVFSRTRCNGPGDSGSAGFGTGSGWIQTHRYKKQLSKEEDAAQRNDITRDKCGLLPIESKLAGERGPLSMGDLSLALDIADCGMSQFPVLVRGLENNYRDGELEHIHDYTFVQGYEAKPASDNVDGDVMLAGPDKGKQPQLANGISHDDEMDLDSDYYWAGADDSALDKLDTVLESTLAVA
jgi:transcriptional coactivator HFI1/ADA1